MASVRLRRIAMSAVATPPTLVGGVLAGALLGNLVHAGLPGHVLETTRIVLSIVPALLGLFAGGALWGTAVGRLIGSGERRRLALAGGASFGVASLVAGLLLTLGENLLIEKRLGPAWPIHVYFNLLFVPSVGLVAGVGASALTWAMGRRSETRVVGLATGLAAAAAFLSVSLTMHALGWHVGGPRAAERATMLTVLLAGLLGASLLGGGVASALLLPRPRLGVAAAADQPSD